LEYNRDLGQIKGNQTQDYCGTIYIQDEDGKKCF